ncbi:MAG: hypothetical protein IT160_21125 [Bryobacterales bacterium]|nr:hypothetical protein [Bryobacterales bacterium]
MANETAADKYRKAIEAAEAIRVKAVEELVAEINGRIEELNSFGCNYRLTDSAPKRRGRRSVSAPAKYCPVCKIEGHDARSHRNQNPKKPFTKAELQERGLA